MYKIPNYGRIELIFQPTLPILLSKNGCEAVFVGTHLGRQRKADLNLRLACSI